MRVAPENIFPGARIRLGEENYFVIKVNAKSFYASKITYLEFVEKYNSRAKGVTFTAFCKANNIKSYKYTEPFEIEENEFSRKLIAKQNAETSYKLEKFEKNFIIEAINYRKKKKRPVKLMPVFQAGNKRVFVLEEKENSYLANIDNDYVLFCLDTDEWIKISTAYDYHDKYKQIPWERLSSFTNAVKTA